MVTSNTLLPKNSKARPAANSRIKPMTARTFKGSAADKLSEEVV